MRNKTYRIIKFIILILPILFMALATFRSGAFNFLAFRSSVVSFNIPNNPFEAPIFALFSALNNNNETFEITHPLVQYVSYALCVECAFVVFHIFKSVIDLFYWAIGLLNGGRDD